MLSQPIWIGIVIAAFVVGLGSTYLIFHTGSSDEIFSSTYDPNTMKFANQELFDQMMSNNPKMMTNWMEPIMQDPQFHDQTMDYMAKNPEQMNQWMIQDPKHVEEMSTAMRENHGFMMEMMSVILNDPDLRLQMIGHMPENPESMEQVMKLVNQEMIMSTMQDSDQITMMEDMMDDMMQRMQTDPELKQAMMEHMDRMKVSKEPMMEETQSNEEMMEQKVVEDSMQEQNVVYDDGTFQLVKVAENIYSFGTTMGSFSLVMVTDDGVIIGDPVNQNHSEIMLKAIRTITDQPIKYLIYSHSHWDHTGGGQVFINEGTTILSHIDARDWLLENSNPNVIVADEVWEGNFKEIVLGGKTLELHHFGPSHGEGMTVFYLPEDKITFIVDIVTPKRIGFTLMPDFTPKGWIQTLIEVEKLDFDTTMFGHKRAIGPASEVTEVREYLQDLRSEIFSMMEEGVNPFMIPSTIELPKYQEWEFYDEWLEMNTWRFMMESHMGW